jgi:hypothetical protein
MRIVRLVLIFWLGAVGTGHAQSSDFTPERLEEFRKLTEDRVEDFQQYLSIIADRQASDAQKKEAIDLAMELFIEGAKMQVSGRDGKPKPPSSIRAYLNRLSGLAQYTKVEITFYDVASVSKFEKGPDGDYHATATYFQQFKGFDAKGQLLYGSKDRKDIAVNGKTGNKDMNKDDLKIFFGNVVVRETTPINGQ